MPIIRYTLFAAQSGGWACALTYDGNVTARKGKTLKDLLLCDDRSNFITVRVRIGTIVNLCRLLCHGPVSQVVETSV